MGMKLYLMRHGHSPSISEAGVAKDELRPLSERGRQGARKTAGELLRRGGKPALILHSPLTRAVQTSEEAEKLVAPSRGRRLFEPLSNVLPPDELRVELEPELQASGEVLCVGHQPQLGELAALLTGQIFDLQPGGVIALEAGASGKWDVGYSFNPQEIP